MKEAVVLKTNEAVVEELRRAILRMHRLGTKYIRIMSYPNDNWSKSDWRKETVKRLKELARIAKKKLALNYFHITL